MGITEASVTTATFEPILDMLNILSKIAYNHLLFVPNKCYLVLGGTASILLYPNP